jgi:hypothetical protein
MRRVYVLCLLTLTVVVLDILLFHTGPAARAQQAQPQPGFRVDRISFYQRNTETAPVYGRIVGLTASPTTAAALSSVLSPVPSIK